MLEIWKEALPPERTWVESLSPSGEKLRYPVDFSAEDVKHFHAETKAMLSAGVPIPLPLEHQMMDDGKRPMGPQDFQDKKADLVRNNTGFAKDVRISPTGRLEVLCGVSDPAITIEQLRDRIRCVSPYIVPDVMDGKGRVWGKGKGAIVHFALTPTPRFLDQKPFGADKAVAASQGIDFAARGLIVALSPGGLCLSMSDQPIALSDDDSAGASFNYIGTVAKHQDHLQLHKFGPKSIMTAKEHPNASASSGEKAQFHQHFAQHHGNLAGIFKSTGEQADHEAHQAAAQYHHEQHQKHAGSAMSHGIALADSKEDPFSSKEEKPAETPSESPGEEAAKAPPQPPAPEKGGVPAEIQRCCDKLASVYKLIVAPGTDWEQFGAHLCTALDNHDALNKDKDDLEEDEEDEEEPDYTRSNAMRAHEETPTVVAMSQLSEEAAKLREQNTLQAKRIADLELGKAKKRVKRLLNTGYVSPPKAQEWESQLQAKALSLGGDGAELAGVFAEMQYAEAMMSDNTDEDGKVALGPYHPESRKVAVKGKGKKKTAALSATEIEEPAGLWGGGDTSQADDAVVSRLTGTKVETKKE